MLDELSACVADLRETSILDTVEYKELLRRFLQTLPEDMRNLFLQRYWYGYSVREIARANKVSTNYIATSLFRTRQKLKQYLETEDITV